MKTNFKYFVLAMLVCSNCYAGKTTTIPQFVFDFLGDSNYTIGKQYYTGFETLSEFSKFYIVPQNYLNTSTHTLTSDNVVSGKLSHKATMFGQNPVYSNGVNSNHRAYPTFQFAQTPLGIVTGSVLVEFWAYSNIQISSQENNNWISLATFTSYADIFWYRGFLINVDSNYNVHLMHVPDNAQAIHDIYQTNTVKFPLNQWAKITAYIDYTSANKFNSPFAAVWQDGQLVSAARFVSRINLDSALAMSNRPPCLDDFVANHPAPYSIDEVERACNLVFTNGLAQAHFGLYTPPLMSKGDIYNDDLTVSEVIKNQPTMSQLPGQ